MPFVDLDTKLNEWRVKARIFTTGPMLGSSPTRGEYLKFLAPKKDKKTGENLVPQDRVPEEAAAIRSAVDSGGEPEEDARISIFPCDKDGNRFIWAYQIKGFFKEAAKMLILANGNTVEAEPDESDEAPEGGAIEASLEEAPKKGKGRKRPAKVAVKVPGGHVSAAFKLRKNYRQIITGLVHVGPDRIYIHRPGSEDLFNTKIEVPREEDIPAILASSNERENPNMVVELPGGEGVLSRPLRAQTQQGERVSINSSEVIPAGSWMDIEIVTLKEYASFIKELLAYGEYQGLLQWRSSGKGRFKTQIWED